MKKMLLVIMLGICFYSDQTRAADLEVRMPKRLSTQEVRAVKNGIKDVLKDPDSAKFGKMVAGKSEDGLVTVCGYVNAKNSFGGYTGNVPYNGVLIGVKGFVLTSELSSEESAIYAVTSVCEKIGLALE